MRLLHIETSGINCSVAISEGERIIAEKSENKGSFTHSESLHLFIEGVVAEAGISLSELDAIAVSAGAGSYTGLRIGLATAKGLCFALAKPLIAVPTLQIIASQVTDSDCIIAMLDARRMEVYSAMFDSKHQFIQPTEAKILEAQSYQDELDRGKVTFIGDGVAKFASICKHPNAVFVLDAYPQAKDMLPFAVAKYKVGAFEDIAYFEPQYLK